MKAEELMVGDWVYMKAHRGFDSQYIRVETIPDSSSDTHHGHIGAYPISEDMDFRDIEDSYLEPIPLTPEILKRIGFKKDKGSEESWYSKAGWMVPSKYNRKAEPISWEVEIIGKYNFGGVIKYVHQLQHALQLCGIRKQINL